MIGCKPLFAALAFTAAAAATAAAAEPSGGAAARLDLAADFERDGEWSAAALEYRRLAADLGPDAPEAFEALHLAAADAYRRGGAADRAEARLRAVEALPARRAVLPLDWVRLRLAEDRRAWASAADLAEGLADDARAAGAEPLRAWALRRAAADWVLAAAPREARRTLADLPEDVRAPLLAALDRAEGAPRKSPRVGGLLGLVPGLGYAYSGEWGNALRSLLLNGLFGWAMFECADDGEWGLFAVCTFFELTWYTGSVYGGIDAAHRFNRAADEAAARDLRGPAEPALRRERGALELFRVRLAF